MSDSGRQMGDCEHGKHPMWCATCLQREILALRHAVSQEREACAEVVESLITTARQKADGGALGDLFAESINMVLHTAAQAIRDRKGP